MPNNHSINLVHNTQIIYEGDMRKRGLALGVLGLSFAWFKFVGTAGGRRIRVGYWQHGCAKLFVFKCGGGSGGACLCVRISFRPGGDTISATFTLAMYLVSVLNRGWGHLHSQITMGQDVACERCWEW